VKITFNDKKLKKYANDDSLAQRKMGLKRAKMFKRRLDDMDAAETLEDIRFAPGRYHELIKDRKGQWACDLDHPYRLIFMPLEEPIPENEDGQYEWDKICGVIILDINDYH